MQIKEVAQLTGITKANIRYYESQGLIFPNREANGYRAYDDSHVRGLLRIKLLRSLGLTIESIKIPIGGLDHASRRTDRTTGTVSGAASGACTVRTGYRNYA